MNDTPDADVDWKAECLKAQEEVEKWKRRLDIETLRTYHDLSFADPPSFHEPRVKSLWCCPQCVERFIERTEKLLGREMPESS